MKNDVIISVKGVSYDYVTPVETVHALKNINCDFTSGHTHAVIGRSGSGKSTLLSLLAGFDKAKTGEILIKGENINNIDTDEYRRKNVGMIFQSYYLIPHLTVYENIRLAMEISKFECGDHDAYIKELLERVMLRESYLKKPVTQLSGGEQQRVAIARAVASDPEIILADEPTGNLDTENSLLIFDLLDGLARDGKCVVVVTHSSELAERCDVMLKIVDGVNV